MVNETRTHSTDARLDHPSSNSSHTPDHFKTQHRSTLPRYRENHPSSRQNMSIHCPPVIRKSKNGTHKIWYKYKDGMQPRLCIRVILLRHLSNCNQTFRGGFTSRNTRNDAKWPILLNFCYEPINSIIVSWFWWCLGFVIGSLYYDPEILM